MLFLLHLSLDIHKGLHLLNGLFQLSTLLSKGKISSFKTDGQENLNRSLAQRLKTLLWEGKVCGSISGPLMVGHSVANAATFLRSCVAQAQSHGDGPRHPLRASAYYREYNED